MWSGRVSTTLRSEGSIRSCDGDGIGACEQAARLIETTMQIDRRCAAGDGGNETDGGNWIVGGVELKWLRKNLVRQDQRICHVFEFRRNSARFRGCRADTTA